MSKNMTRNAAAISEQGGLTEAECQLDTSPIFSIRDDTTKQLEDVFADLSEFEVGELSRLCISKDHF